MIMIEDKRLSPADSRRSLRSGMHGSKSTTWSRLQNQNSNIVTPKSMSKKAKTGATRKVLTRKQRIKQSAAFAAPEEMVAMMPLLRPQWSCDTLLACALVLSGCMASSKLVVSFRINSMKFR
eukprot:766842-Hanusia_phi.AAC.5